LLWFLGVSGGLTSTALVVYELASPAKRRSLSREHGVVEVPTAVVFLTAAVVSFYVLRRARAGRSHPRWTIAVLACLALLDELNWVVFSLGVRRPSVLGHRVDSLHDFLEIAVIQATHRAPWGSLLVAGVATAGLVSWAPRPAGGRR
jgi:hypothetical protein